MDSKANIIKWYPFEEGATVLEIYEENSILESLKNKLNLESCHIKQLQLQGEYDYITLIGTYEYAPTIYQEQVPYVAFLKDLKKHLKPQGKILLAIDNRLGIKYFAGAKSKHYHKIFEGIQSEIRAKEPNLLLKGEIENFVQEAGFQNYKFYYPLPDYTNTNCIFTDEFLPKSNHSKIIYPVHYEKGSMIIYNEIDVIRQICKNEKFIDFTNSYFIEISNAENINQIKFVNYNILRKEQYQLMVMIHQDMVEKLPENEKSKEHVKQIGEYINHLKQLGFEIIETVEKEKIASKFITAEELDKIIVREIQQRNIQQVYQQIEDWYKYIKERLEKEEVSDENAFTRYHIQIPKEIEEKMHFIKSGYIDLSFENIFYYNNQYHFYDQEWCIENLPLEFILYRAINNLYTYNENSLKQIIEKEEIWEHFNLSEFVTYFKELEKAIQSEILDEEKVNEYKKEIKQYLVDLESLKEAENEKYIQIEKYKSLKEEKDKIESQYQTLLKEYNTSRGWKLIKMGRKLLGKGQ